MSHDGNGQLGDGVRRFKRYPAYRESGFGWLSDAPNHWHNRRLKFILKNGLNNGLFKKKEHFGHGVRLVNVFDIYRDNFLIAPDTLDRVDATRQEQIGYEVVAGDVFFVRSSLKLEGVGRSACMLGVDEPTVFECHLVRGRPRKHVVDPKFLINYLNSYLTIHRLIALSNTTTMTTMDQEQFASLEVLLPPLDEQRQIAAFLDRETVKIDALVAKMERLIELLQEKRTAFISHAVTKGLDPNVPMKDSGVEWLGQIPAHWEVKPLGRAVSISGGSTPSKDNVAYWDGNVPWVPSPPKSKTVSTNFVNTAPP